MDGGKEGRKGGRRERGVGGRDGKEREGGGVVGMTGGGVESLLGAKQHRWLVEVLLYVHRNRRLIRDGEPRTATSTFTQLLSSATEMGISVTFIVPGSAVPAAR